MGCTQAPRSQGSKATTSACSRTLLSELGPSYDGADPAYTGGIRDQFHHVIDIVPTIMRSGADPAA
jgi:hypothetical protein